MRNQDLYFMQNPALGIIKIGVAKNVESRRLVLECACGVPLKILAVVAGGGRYETELHWAFRSSRLLGEWFSPTPELLEVANNPAQIRVFVEHKDAEMRAWQAAHQAEKNAVELKKMLDRKAQDSAKRAEHPAAKARERRRIRVSAALEGA